MATVVSQHVRHLGRHLGIFKNYIFRKSATNFTGISRKHVFLTSNRKIIENRVKKKNLEQMFSKFNNFLFRTLICIINYYVYIISDDSIQLTSKNVLIIRLQVLKVAI